MKPWQSIAIGVSTAWRRGLLWAVSLSLMPLPAFASSKKLDWIPWIIGISVMSALLAWRSAKRTKMLDNIHLRIIGFSVYFWLYFFAQMLIVMVLWSITK